MDNKFHSGLNTILYIILFMMICPINNLWSSKTNSEISIKMLSENRKTIPIYFQNGEFWNTNICLPDILIENNYNKEVMIKETVVIGSVEGNEVVFFKIDEENLKKSISTVNKLLNSLIRQPMNNWSTYNLHTLFGKVPIPSKSFKDANILEPQEQTCIRLSDLLYFHYIGLKKADDLLCEIKIDIGGEEKSYKYQIVLTPYTCKGDYIFPVKGMVTVIGTPWNLATGHRGAVSQEFAFDVVDYQRLENGELSLSSPPHSNKVTDYFSYHREVHAIGEGIVVAVGNNWPDKWVENPKKYSINRVTDLTSKLIKKGMDFNHAILGNYVIIDHQNEEFSLYAHMSEGTVTVKIGEHVQQGQVIGKIGNTSNSTDPHLHLQLMDSKDFPSSNGLPIMFKDIKLPSDPVQDFENSNSLLYGDYIFIYIQD